MLLEGAPGAVEELLGDGKEHLMLLLKRNSCLCSRKKFWFSSMGKRVLQTRSRFQPGKFPVLGLLVKLLPVPF